MLELVKSEFIGKLGIEVKALWDLFKKYKISLPPL